MARATLADLPFRRPRESYRMYPQKDLGEYTPPPMERPPNPSANTFNERFTPMEEVPAMSDLYYGLKQKYPNRPITSPVKSVIENISRGGPDTRPKSDTYPVPPGYQERYGDPSKVISDVPPSLNAPMQTAGPYEDKTAKTPFYSTRPGVPPIPLVPRQGPYLQDRLPPGKPGERIGNNIIHQGVPAGWEIDNG